MNAYEMHFLEKVCNLMQWPYDNVLSEYNHGKTYVDVCLPTNVQMTTPLEGRVFVSLAPYHEYLAGKRARDDFELRVHVYSDDKMLEKLIPNVWERLSMIVPGIRARRIPVIDGYMEFWIEVNLSDGKDAINRKIELMFILRERIYYSVRMASQTFLEHIKMPIRI